MRYVFNFRDIWAHQAYIIEGIGVTLVLSLVTMVAGLILGAVLSAMRVYGDPRLRAFSATYVEVIRNTPLLVQLFIVFFGLPSIGLRLDAMTAAIIALAINLGAYSTEIVRAGLEAIPRTQIEAGHSLGLSGSQVFRHVVLVPALQDHVPGAHQPVRAADAGDQRRVADLGAGSLPRRLDHPVPHLPRFRGLHGDRRGLSRARAGLQPRASRRSSTWRSPADDPGIRLHRRLLSPARRALDTGADRRSPSWAAASSAWSIALLRVSPCRAAALLGAGYVQIVQGMPLLVWLFVLFFGLPIFGVRGLALDRRPWSPSRSMPAPSWARSGAAACRRSRASSGRPAPRSASASSSSCATSSCRRPSASPSRRPSASSSSSSRTRRSPSSIGFVELTREGQTHHGRDLPALHRLHRRRRPLFRAVLPADAVEPPPGTEAPCRSLRSPT